MSYSKVYAFDWDDNILHMPSTMIIYRSISSELYPAIRAALVEYSRSLNSETAFTLPEDFMALTDDDYQSIMTLIGEASSLNIAIPYPDCSSMEIKDDTPLSPTTASSAFASDAGIPSTKLAEFLSPASVVSSFFPPSQRHSSHSSTSVAGTSSSSATALYFLLPRESIVQDDVEEHSLSVEASPIPTACHHASTSSSAPAHITEALSLITQPCYRVITLAPTPCLPSCHHCAALDAPSPPSLPSSPSSPSSIAHPLCRRFLHRDHISTQAFARMRASLPQYHCMLKADSYLNFSSSAAFTADVAAALRTGSTAAAYDRFKMAAMGANLITIVTARGQHPRALRAGLRMVVGSWSEEERRVMRENVVRVYGREWELEEEEEGYCGVDSASTLSTEVTFVTAETPYAMATPPAPCHCDTDNNANAGDGGPHGNTSSNSQDASPPDPLLPHTPAPTVPRPRARTHVRALYPALADADDPVLAYLEHVVAVFPVSSAWFRHTFVHKHYADSARAAPITSTGTHPLRTAAITAYNTEIGKEIALGHYVRQCLAAVRYQHRHTHAHHRSLTASTGTSAGTGTSTGQMSHSSTTAGGCDNYLLAFGFSDDDKRNVHAISTLFATMCVQYPQVKFVVYDTSEAGQMKKIVISSNHTNKQI